MPLPQDQVSELRLLCPNLRQADEAGRTYIFLPGLSLPEGCDPAVCDALLCPSERDGYPSRLFFAERIKSRAELNWNSTGVRILETNWQAYSWKVNPDMRLAQMVAAHVRALR